MPKSLQQIIQDTARMWPREIFYHIADDGAGRRKPLAKSLEFLNNPGVYVLYRDDIPYYIGQADRLRSRLWNHAMRPEARRYNFWNFFSAFVVLETDFRNQIEAILIAAMPTANSARPRLPKTKFPPAVIKMVREIRKAQANPSGS